MPEREPYRGTKRRLVLAFDLGTTFSGISYAVLDPGIVPKIHTVMRYPGQETRDSKVQTVIYYDVDGKVVATGAEQPPAGDDSDEEDEWQDIQPHKLEWFKLLLRPKHTTTPNQNIPTPKLPPSKDIVDVFADFYRYLFARARDYIRQTHANGDSLWDSVADDIDFVLSHPNGWEGAQQGAMRRAAVKAGLVPDTPAGRERVTFVSEGEASFHYCLSSSLVADSIKTGNNLMIIDAGGGTVDLSAYTFAEESPIKINEIAASGSMFEGSVIVRNRAEQHLVARLRNSKFSGQAYIDSMVDEFDRITKKRFTPAVGDSYIKFSNMLTDRDVKAGIRNGQIKLTQEEVSGFFDPGIEEIINAIKAQRDAAAPASISTYFLVGGFAASEYLFAKLDAFLADIGCRLFRPDDDTKKAVAEGAVSFQIDRFVHKRVAKASYGIICHTHYDASDPSRAARSERRIKNLEGYWRLPYWFDVILERGTQVSESTTFKSSTNKKSERGVDSISSKIRVYRGSKTPQWFDEDPDGFSTLCKITGDVSSVPKLPQMGLDGQTFYRQNYDIVLSFGLTELKAHLEWTDRGVLCRGPASVIYEDDFVTTVSDD